MYLIFEIQKLSSTSVAVPSPIFSTDNWNQAESEFHRLCSIAAVSSVMRHTIIMVDDGGIVYKAENYDHPIQEEEV